MNCNNRDISGKKKGWVQKNKGKKNIHILIISHIYKARSSPPFYLYFSTAFCGYRPSKAYFNLKIAKNYLMGRSIDKIQGLFLIFSPPRLSLSTSSKQTFYPRPFFPPVWISSTKRHIFCFLGVYILLIHAIRILTFNFANRKSKRIAQIHILNDNGLL